MNRIVAAALPLLAAFSALSLTPPLAAQTAVTSAAANLTLGFIDSAIAERRLKSAVELIRAAEARNPGPELELRKAELLLAAGALDEAQTAFQKLEADAAVAARAKVGRSIALLNAGHPNQADTLLAEALALDPSMVRGWSARGVLADRRGDWKSAEASYAQGLAADPKSATLLNNRGYSRLLQGRNPEAEADFMAALAIQPGMEAAATNLRLARGLQGRYAEAFDGATREDLARDLNTVGVAAMLRGDHRLAESYFSRAIEMNTKFDKTATANLAYLKHVAPELTEPARTAPSK
ncbi:tetratricopeptide repeat protein [Sandaracinobacteroides hominis]|uniref:tetratricopeptide repeat protein n=1 Tax=Sandaracinobacteroides hominis TaxID=2780086 RepID=UPI0018F5C26B|nr:tetratricopeptide repeat protein [Sandaracinobacteroides hominis]